MVKARLARCNSPSTARACFLLERDTVLLLPLSQPLAPTALAFLPAPVNVKFLVGEEGEGNGTVLHSFWACQIVEAVVSGWVQCETKMDLVLLGTLMGASPMVP